MNHVKQQLGHYDQKGNTAIDHYVTFEDLGSEPQEYFSYWPEDPHLKILNNKPRCNYGVRINSGLTSSQKTGMTFPVLTDLKDLIGLKLQKRST